MAFNTAKKDVNVEFNAPGMSESSSTSASYLGKTLEINGEIKSDEYLTIEGKIKGNIQVTKTLTIGKNGYVEGEIKADEVKIHGKVEGNITAARKLEISSSGQFLGTIKAEKLSIAEGAVFKGKVNVDEE